MMMDIYPFSVRADGLYFTQIKDRVPQSLIWDFLALIALRFISFRLLGRREDSRPLVLYVFLKRQSRFKNKVC